MGKIFDAIDDNLRAFIDEQKMFFVATAPLTPDGHINVSPKGLAGTFAVIDPGAIEGILRIGVVCGCLRWHIRPLAKRSARAIDGPML